MVPGSVDQDEDLPLFEEDLVPPLLRGLRQRRSRLDVEAVLGGQGHEGGDVAAGGVAVGGGGSMSGAVETSVCGSPSPDSAADTMTEHGISNKSSNGSETRSCMELIQFLIRAPASPAVLDGLDWYRWGRVGSFLCSSTGFTLNSGSKC